MKAREYFANYQERIAKDPAKAGKELFTEFSVEAAKMMNTRGVESDRDAAKIIRWQNDKWNAVVKKIRQSMGGLSPIKENAFRVIWVKREPRLGEFL